MKPRLVPGDVSENDLIRPLGPSKAAAVDFLCHPKAHQHLSARTGPYAAPQQASSFAMAWLMRLSETVTQPTFAQKTPMSVLQRPYTTLISSLSSSNPPSQGTLGRVFRTIRYLEIRIDSVLFRALISRSISGCDVKKTMALYDALGTARRET
ncbi:hypothetical protein PM082_010992 [Marasmius tenuissimus]|nr:hypothetical protein PM082_010992 [Marasmius tenuissimus]